MEEVEVFTQSHSKKVAEKELGFGFSGAQGLVKVGRKVPHRVGPKSELSALSLSLRCIRQAEASSKLFKNDALHGFQARGEQSLKISGNRIQHT